MVVRFYQSRNICAVGRETLLFWRLNSLNNPDIPRVSMLTAGCASVSECVCFPLTVEAGEAEHADLLGDVVPGPRGAQSLQLGLQLIPHQQDTVCHGLHVTLPIEGSGEGEEEGRQDRK